jgi:hypothetical protein
VLSYADLRLLTRGALLRLFCMLCHLAIVYYMHCLLPYKERCLKKQRSVTAVAHHNMRSVVSALRIDFRFPSDSGRSALINDITASDSAEKLIHGVLESLQELQTVGTLSQHSAAVEISNKSVQSSVWEKPLNVFSNVTLISYLISFAF